MSSPVPWGSTHWTKLEGEKLSEKEISVSLPTWAKIPWNSCLSFFKSIACPGNECNKLRQGYYLGDKCAVADSMSEYQAKGMLSDSRNMCRGIYWMAV